MQRLTIYCAMFCCVGCSSALPPVKPPSFDTLAVAEEAITEFDANDDHTISRAEACDGMTRQWARYDQDGDDTVTVAELQQRFEQWTDGDTGMMNLRAEVIYRGKPLTGASITMTPYDFLEDHVQPAEGKTDTYGYAFLSIPKTRLPESQQATYGMQVGLYHVAIKHPKRDLPAKYNAQTELSVDLSPQEGNTGVRFDLK